MDLTEFNEIRSYNDEELPQIFEELIADPAFQKVVAGVIPNVHSNCWHRRCVLVRQNVNFRKRSVMAFCGRLRRNIQIL